MSARKHRLFASASYDREGITRALERMAARGWMLENMGTYFWTYRRCEPVRAHFACVWLSGDAGDREEYRALAEHDGWEFVCGSPLPNRTFGSWNGYLPIPDASGYVLPGSALDCSAMTQTPLRKRLCADPNGNLVLEGDRGPIRLLSFNGELPEPVRNEPYLKTVREYFNQQKTSIERVIFNVFKDLDAEIYRRLLESD